MIGAQRATRYHVGATEDFPLNEFRVFDLGGRSVGVVRTKAGFYAIRNRCPHQGAAICEGLVGGTMTVSAPQEFRYSDEVVVATCPWHRWEFELDGGASYGGVTNKRLRTYRVEIEDGDIFVSTQPVAGKREGTQ